MTFAGRTQFPESWTAFRRKRARNKHAWQPVSWLCALLLCLPLHSATAQNADKESARTLSYLTEVRPLLANRCFTCHGPDEAQRKAELRLDIESDSNNAADAPRAIVPGSPDASEVMKRITSADLDIVMPPPDAGPALTAHEIETLRQWITEGAQRQIHWAFVPPQQAAPLPNPPPHLKTWCRSPVDHFVAARLVAAELEPASQADPYLLIRRVYLDLTGLPPTAEQADAFAAAPTDMAYQEIVDRLLQSPRFGEHWARSWLDLARYADTKGYEKDQPRNIWRYRDWVINAINSDMPFDQFTREQLAGDLLPDASTDQILATAFHRNTMTNDEGGTDNEEYRVAAVKDRVDTTVQVWMGLTMGCAKCHSHKYDPISQHDYYRLLAYFNQTEDADRPDDAPRLKTPTPEQQQKLDDLAAQIKAVRRQYEQVTPALTAAQLAWEQTAADNPDWRPLLPTAAVSQNGGTLNVQQDNSILASGNMPATDVYDIRCHVPSTTTVTALRLEMLTHASLPSSGPGRNPADPNFVLNELTAQVIDDDGAVLKRLALAGAKADFSQGGWDVAGAIDGQTRTGWAISPQQKKPHVAIFALTEPYTFSDGQRLQLSLSQQYSGTSLLIGRLRVSTSSGEPALLQPELQTLAELAAIDADQRTAAQQKTLDEAFRQQAAETAPLFQRLRQLEQQVTELTNQIPDTPIMRDLAPASARRTYVHVRGNFLDPGDEVTPMLPESLSFTTAAYAAKANRLDVADWLMSPENPLTARVAVNRVWAQFFGRGLVETEEDFGLQGAAPSHPLLLDWLAVEFRDTLHWSHKQLCREIVLSSTYRQSATASPSSLQTDPDNRLLSRSARYRLTAETTRDQALAVAGILSPKVGGPSVMPPQPDGIWRTTYSSLKWETPDNEDRYRRGIYTFIRRTSPYPSLITFDGGSREVCQIRRIRTNTPLQALVTLNDPVFIEAAGALALRFAGTSDGEALEAMFRAVLIRPMDDAESRRLATLYDHTLADFTLDQAAAQQLLKSANVADQTAEPARARLAALTMVASVLINLDESLTRP